MNGWLDVALVSLVVLFSTAYAVYALGPKKLKGWVMQQTARIFGLRALSLMNRSPGGCDGCGSGSAQLDALKARQKPGKPVVR